MANVLVVDDEKSIRVTLNEFLGGEGHDVTLAETAGEALRVVVSKPIDVVVTDIVLPRMNGVELLRTIRKQNPTLQVIMMTGEPTVDTATAAVRAGAFDYLFKPISKDGIVRTVANAARVKNLSDQRTHLEALNEQYRENLERLVSERTLALQESERRYRQLVHHSPDGIVVHRDGEIVFINETMSRMLAGKREQFVGREVLDFVHPDYREIAAARAQMVLEGGEAVEHAEEVLVGLDGREVHVDTIALPFSHEGKDAVQVVIRDVTRERHLSEQLRQSQKMEAIGQLAGGIAHDFNNLLMVILNGANFVLDELPGNSVAHADIKEVIDAGKRATELTRQLLAFSRRQTLVPRVTDLNMVVKGIEKMIARLLGEEIAVTMQVARQPCPAKIDLGQMEQVLVNLAVNARDAMPSGGDLTIGTEKCCLTEKNIAGFTDVGEAIAGDYILISVSDTGVGMDAETVSRIFEPFFTTKQVGRGTGLGLSTVYGIVKQHDGYIDVRSEPGEGTTFSVYIPETRETEELKQGRGSLSILPHGKETILLVEDEDTVRRTSSKMLSRLGYTVVEASNGPDAIAIIKGRSTRFDLLLTDIIMPEMDGAELVRTVRKLDPDIKVIFSSGYPESHLLQHGLDLTGIVLLRKPFSRNDLARNVRDVLDGRA